MSEGKLSTAVNHLPMRASPITFSDPKPSKDHKLKEYGFMVDIPKVPSIQMIKRKMLKKKRSGQVELTSYGVSVKSRIDRE